MQTNSIRIDRVAAMDLLNTRHAFPTESKDISILPFSAPTRKWSLGIDVQRWVIPTSIREHRYAGG